MTISKMWQKGIDILFKPKTELYEFQGMVQFDEHKNLTVCGCKVLWLDKVLVEDVSEKEATKIAFKILKLDYPGYGDMIQLG